MKTIVILLFLGSIFTDSLFWIVVLGLLLVLLLLNSGERKRIRKIDYL